MARLMLFTLGGALIADVGAQGTELEGVLAAACHERRRQTADGGAVDVEFNTPCKCRDLIVAQASGRALIAGIGALVAGLDTRAKLLDRHGTFLQD